MGREVIASIAGEYDRLRALAEGAIRQLEGDGSPSPRDATRGNSIPVLMTHMGGNLHSRFRDFLTTDGEKPDRDREGEFAECAATSSEVMRVWSRGWETLTVTLAELTDADLARTVTIRGRPLSVAQALHRSLAHIAYHVGQLVDQARARRGARWQFLSIPPGGTGAYDENPDRELPEDLRRTTSPDSGSELRPEA